jgi:CRISPR-associated protein Cas2
MEDGEGRGGEEVMGKRESKASGERLEERFAGWGEEAGRPKRHFVVVSYDSPDDRRRNRVCKLLKDYGERVQYSVFECLLRPEELKRLRERLKPLLVPEEDDVRFYRLCENCRRKATVWGRRKRKQWDQAVVV